jgi:hypothetical protein
MKRLILLVLFCVTTFTFGQTENEKIDFPNANRSYITFDLSTPINLVAPRYRFGYINSLSENWRIGIDLGFGSEWTTWKYIINDDNDDYLLVEGRFELYHILNPTKRVNIYISGEAYYIYQEEVYYFGEYEPEDQDFYIRYDRADFRRQKYGINMKFGVMIPFGEYVGMNAYIGAGPRVRDVTFSNVVNPVPFMDYYDDESWLWDSQYKTEGTEIGLNFTLGIKFFYVIQ